MLKSPFIIALAAFSCNATILTTFTNNIAPSYVTPHIDVTDIDFNTVIPNNTVHGFEVSGFQYTLPIKEHNFSFTLSPETSMRVDGISFDIKTEYLSSIGHNKMLLSIYDGAELHDSWLFSVSDNPNLSYHSLFNSFETMNDVTFIFSGIPGAKYDKVSVDNLTIWGDAFASPPPAVPEVNTAGLVLFGGIILGMVYWKKN